MGWTEDAVEEDMLDIDAVVVVVVDLQHYSSGTKLVHTSFDAMKI